MLVTDKIMNQYRTQELIDRIKVELNKKNDIIPFYNSLGDHTDGAMTQKAITEELGSRDSDISQITLDFDGRLNNIEHKNLLANTKGSMVINGVTFTVNEDQSITINGTATSDTGYEINNPFTLPDGDYIVTSGSTGDTGMGEVFINGIDSSGIINPVSIAGSNIRNGDLTISNSSYSTYQVGVYVKSGNTVNNKTIYPMIRKASDPITNYIPYTMDNSELSIYNFVDIKSLLDTDLFNTSGSVVLTRYGRLRIITISGIGLKAAHSGFDNVTILRNLDPKDRPRSNYQVDGSMYFTNGGATRLFIEGSKYLMIWGNSSITFSGFGFGQIVYTV